MGAFIEEIDIQDLQDLIDQTSNETIKMVYTNLLRASGNHLRAFTGQLSARSNDYVPQVLTEKQFRAILDTPHQGGMGNGNCGRQNNCNNGNARGKGRQYHVEHSFFQQNAT